MRRGGAQQQPWPAASRCAPPIAPHPISPVATASAIAHGCECGTRPHIAMVPRGLEPRTLRVLAARSNQLSYETLDVFSGIAK